ncbi:MAG: 23S rRNA (guanosine(2251)-2'-O)-methyltransferase RlmB [Actinobacteria bacterium]|jgi:23S rRNA (guanosine2251-2'-O)-methyltransferase|nr:23S rRNA (guanosine(2251)-2'-O)-methyltransferase RlmB [Actinomycetota bacterium]NBR67821.1 23S rRNA (guanosine(2251)-2'-O)-methyltransferase RlmB [Actinomycetota bacterium]
MAARRGGTPAGRGGASSGRGRHSGNSTRGAARTSKPVRTGGPRRMIEDKKGAKAPVKEKGLGGEQVEGRQAVRELLIAQRRKVREIWMAADIDTAPIIEDIEELAHAQRVTVLEVPRRKIEEKARSEAPQGVIAFAAEVPEADFGEMLRGTKNVRPFLVAVDGVTDPGNLGALLRCCDGAGVTGVVLPKHRTVHVTPTVAKAAAGAVEHVPMALVSGLPTAINQMKSKGIWVVGLDDGGRDSLFDIGKLANEGICVVLGAEGSGLSRLVKDRCDTVVNIPMLGQVSSLNVSAAAALATYEVARVRLQK